LWRNRQLIVLSDFAGNGGEANTIDDDGTIYGICSSEDPSDRIPVRWVRGSISALPITFGQDYIGVVGVGRSRSATVSGFLVQREITPDGIPYLVNIAIGWKDGAFRTLERPTGRGNSRSFGVNRQGIYAGSVEDEVGNTIPTLWDQEGVTQLPLELDRSAIAVALNEKGLVVGFDKTDVFNPVPVIWRTGLSPQLRMTDARTSAGNTILMTTTARQGNQPARNRSLTMRVNGKPVGRATTNERGTATFQYKVPANAKGALSVNITDGKRVSIYRQIVVNRDNTTAAIAPARTKQNRTVPLNATLRTADTNLPLNNRSVTFVVGNRVLGKATTDRNGVARANVTLPNSFSGSRLPIEVRFTGDTEVNGKTGRASLYIVP
jgi:hypothetical protein